MLGRFLLIFSSMHVAYAISILLEKTSLRLMKKRAKSCQKIEGEDKISVLPDDLLVHILSFVQTKDAVATMILSKRWLLIWTMVPRLGYQKITDDDTHKVFIDGFFGRLLARLFGKSDQQHRRLWRFIDKSLHLHKAPVLETLVIELGPSRCHVDVDVRKWIAKAVDRRVRELGLMLTWSAEPASLSKSLYTCDTIVKLYLSDKILVDVPSRACLPSLKSIGLYSVTYKDEDSHVRLLSNCPTLKCLAVERHGHDNVTNFNIKVPSLEYLLYDYVNLGEHNEGIGGSLVIDSPAVKIIFYRDFSGDTCSIENEPRFEKANINAFSYPDDKFIISLSSVMKLELGLSVEADTWCNAIYFSQLMECNVTLMDELDWLESLMGLLHNSPNLKVLFIDQTGIRLEDDFSLSWNEPSSVPRCLSARLEIFEWKGYIGRSKEEEAIKYIFANSKCLKRAGVSLTPTCKFEDREKIMKQIESVSRVSTSSQLLFSTQFEFPSVVNEMNENDD